MTIYTSGDNRGNSHLQNFLSGLTKLPVQWTVIWSPAFGLSPEPGFKISLVTPSLTWAAMVVALIGNWKWNAWNSNLELAWNITIPSVPCLIHCSCFIPWSHRSSWLSLFRSNIRIWSQAERSERISPQTIAKKFRKCFQKVLYLIEFIAMLEGREFISDCVPE